MSLEVLVVGQLKTNCYLYYNELSRQAVIIDPGDDGEYIISKIKDLNLRPLAILATHGHFDHVLAATELKLAFSIPFYLNKKDLSLLKRAQKTAKFYTQAIVDPPALVDEFLINNQIFKINGLSLKTLVTPGHTKGSVCFYVKQEKLIFTGDTLFSRGSFGRTDLPGGSLKAIKRSIKKILQLPAKTVIYPGHQESTTIENEKRFYSSLLA